MLYRSLFRVIGDYFRRVKRSWFERMPAGMKVRRGPPAPMLRDGFFSNVVLLTRHGVGGPFAPSDAPDELLDFGFAEGIGVGEDDQIGGRNVEPAADQIGRGENRRRAVAEGGHHLDSRDGPVNFDAVAAVTLAVLGGVGHVAAQLLHGDAVRVFEPLGQLRDVAAGAADDEDARLALEMIANERVGVRELLGRRLAPDALRACGPSSG